MLIAEGTLTSRHFLENKGRGNNYSSPEEVDAMTQKQKGAIAVINDDVTQRILLSGLLDKEGFYVLAFDGAEEALKGMDPDNPPELIITDLYMPGMDGWRFCRLLRSPEYPAFNPIPIFVVSAIFSGEEVVRITADLGANAFMASPVDAQRFMAHVRSLLSGEILQVAPRVLIIEDSGSLAGLLAQVFMAHGYHVRTAGTGGEAIKYYREDLPDIVVADYHLPDMSGEYLLAELNAIDTCPTMIVITSDPDPGLALRVMKLGARAYARKPFDPEYLITICESVRRERSLLQVEDRLEERTRQLRESEERYRRITQAITDYIYTVQLNNGNATDTMHGPGCVAVTGYSEQEFTEDPYHWHRIIPSEDQPLVEEQTHRILAGEDPIPIEHRIFRKDGALRWVSNTPVMHRDEHGRLLSYDGLIQDITDRKQAEEERIKLEEQLIQAQKMESIGRLAGGVAHDFNNLLSPILCYTELLLADLSSSDPWHGRLERIHYAAERARDLTRQLLAFSRKQVLDKKLVNLKKVILDFEKLLRRTVREDIQIRLRLPPDLSAVRADVGQIEQILMNLVVNAQDAMPEGGILNLELADIVLDEDYAANHQGVTPGSYVQLTVSDTGCGMDPGTLNRIFEPFFTTKTRGEGTGLGLSMVYGIVKQHGGYISAYSEEGLGTSFNIHLPRSEETEEIAAASSVSAVHAPRGMETVLVVEDNKSVLEMVCQILKRQGYRAIKAENAAHCIEVAKACNEPIDLLLTDVVMPGMNGKELFKRLTTTQSKLKVIYMSGYTDDTIVYHGILEDEINFIQKPFSVQSLAQKVREVLDR